MPAFVVVCTDGTGIERLCSFCKQPMDVPMEFYVCLFAYARDLAFLAQTFARLYQEFVGAFLTFARLYQAFVGAFLTFARLYQEFICISNIC